MSLILPRGFVSELPGLLAAHGLEKWQRPALALKLVCIVDHVLERACRHANQGANCFGGFVSFPVETVGRLIGGREYVKAARSALETIGVLEVAKNRNGRPRYHAGKYPGKVRLRSPWDSRPLDVQEFKNTPLFNRLRKQNSDASRDAVGENRARLFVLQSLQALSFPSDVAETIPEEVVRRDGASSRRGESLSSSAIRWREWAWIAGIRDLASHRWWIRADPKTGRVFHNVTNMPRELRGQLLVDGEKSVEVDIANAQPAFCLSLYPQDCAEKQRFAATVSRGEFYQTLCGAVAKKHANRWKAKLTNDRDGFKVSVFKGCFYGTHPKRPGVLWAAFASLWPVLARLIREHRATSDGLSRRLQSVEADLVLGRVIPRIMAELPGVPVVTIHDGLLCSSSHAEAVRQIVESETEARFGVRLCARLKE